MGGCDVHEALRAVDLAHGHDQLHGLLEAGALLAVQDGLLLIRQYHGRTMAFRLL